MSTKLTLTIDKDIIASAKLYAKRTNRSLSNIIEQYLKSLISQSNKYEVSELSSLVNELKGSVNDPDISKSYKEMLVETKIKKHLK